VPMLNIGWDRITVNLAAEVIIQILSGGLIAVCQITAGMRPEELSSVVF